MRIRPDDKFWVVTDPKPQSDLGAICFETTLRGLDLQFKGGLTMAQDPTIFTDRAEAEAEAQRRLVALAAFQAILQSEESVESARGITLVNGEGRTILEIYIR